MNEALLNKYLSGNCTTKERREVEQWIRESKANELYFDRIKSIWSVEPKEKFKPDVLQAWERVEGRMGSVNKSLMEGEKDSLQGFENRKTRPKDVRKEKHSNSILYMVAAVLVIVMGVLFVVESPLGGVDPKMVEEEIVAREITTEKGQRTTFRLSDGSRVVLNAESKIVIPGDFNASNRELFLEGEAYFEVESDKEHPFIVYSKGTFTRVLGTKFSISAHAKEGKVLAAVEEGRVAFGSQGNPSSEFEELRKNEIGEVDADGSSRVYYQENLEEYLGWKDGKLVFKDAPFDEVINKLERWYDIEITIPDATGGYKKLTASFDDEPMTEVLNVIAVTLHITYKKDGRNIEFKK